MNPYSTHPSQDQDGKEDTFRKATADVFESDDGPESMLEKLSAETGPIAEKP